MRVRSAGVARRYARALLDVALAQGDPAAVKADLDGVTALVRREPELRTFLDHPAVSPDKKKAVVRAVAKGLSPQAQRLLDLLIDRQRTAILGEVTRTFTAVWNAHRGVVEAEAVSAAALDETERRALQVAVEKASGRTVELTAAVDPSLVGGVLLRMEGRVYDGSVRARLAALRARLAGHRAGTA